MPMPICHISFADRLGFGLVLGLEIAASLEMLPTQQAHNLN